MSAEDCMVLYFGWGLLLAELAACHAYWRVRLQEWLLGFVGFVAHKFGLPRFLVLWVACAWAHWQSWSLHSIRSTSSVFVLWGNGFPFCKASSCLTLLGLQTCMSTVGKGCDHDSASNREMQNIQRPQESQKTWNITCWNQLLKKQSNRLLRRFIGLCFGFWAFLGLCTFMGS